MPVIRSMFVARTTIRTHCDSITTLCHVLWRRKALKNSEAAIIMTLAVASATEKVIGVTPFLCW